MAGNIDLSRIPGKKGDPYRGQAVYQPQPDSEWNRQHKIKLPAIPDLRFESAYLSAIRPFVTGLDKQADKPPETKTEEAIGSGALASGAVVDYGVPIRINWPAVLWVTIRDQVIVQFITGGVYATWAIFGTPFLKSIRSGFVGLFNPPKRRPEEMKSALRHLVQGSHTGR
ncbi:hypothetical protein FS842_007953 [Serendipita sp. 407]|nr:hypothetical protein FS842_007953 [Serendipita sp. 407]